MPFQSSSPFTDHTLLAESVYNQVEVSVVSHELMHAWVLATISLNACISSSISGHFFAAYMISSIRTNISPKIRLGNENLTDLYSPMN